MLAHHWEQVYRTKDVHTVSWYQPVPHRSLQLLGGVLAPGDAVVDVGAGASTLADHLLARGPIDLTLVDISSAALDLVRTRLLASSPAASPGSSVRFVQADLRSWVPDRRFDAWHDRAVFHFLTDPAEQQAYARTVAAAVRPGGHVMVSAFHRDGPDRCSDLPTARYDADGLHEALGGDAVFARVHAERELHPHPRGGTQDFQVLLLQRR
ncbi:MAG: class I SAM-dependent methyltransferase [Alphaproteobacteria bacterium]|nr:class I SAM-dependent methyltransferase [Alphaproteobacteria bacterium]